METAVTVVSTAASVLKYNLSVVEYIQHTQPQTLISSEHDCDGVELAELACLKNYYLGCFYRI